MSKTPETLTNEECDKLLDFYVLDLDNLRYRFLEIRNYTMTLLMLDAGLRVGEVVHLLCIDLWFQDEPVANLLIRSEISKGQHERIVPMSVRLRMSITLMHKHVWPPQHPKDIHHAFYNNRNLQHITVRQVERIISYTSLRAIGHRIHPHVLRHTFASRLMRKCNARIVQELLGHKSLQSTQVYTHPNSDDLKNAIDSLDSTGDT